MKIDLGAAALAAILLFPGAVCADTIGPGEFPAWEGCEIPVLRIVEPALPPDVWPGAVLSEGAALAYVWQLAGEDWHARLRRQPPVPPIPQVSLAGAVPYLSGAIAVLAIAALSRRKF